MKPDQERVKNLLTDTVTLLCRNGLSFHDELRVEGLIGITVDNNEVFLVHINQKFGGGGSSSGGNELSNNMTLMGGDKVTEDDHSDTEDSTSSTSRVDDHQTEKVKVKPDVSASVSKKPAPSPVPKQPPRPPSPPDIKPVIKPEPIDDDSDDDLVIVSAKTEPRSPDSFHNSSNSGPPRVPPLHGIPQGDFSMLNPDHLSNQDSGEPPSKRRHSESRNHSSSSDSYNMGSMGGQTPQSDSASWSIPPDLASQMMEGGQNAAWNMAGVPGTSGQMGTPEQMVGSSLIWFYKEALPHTILRSYMKAIIRCPF